MLVPKSKSKARSRLGRGRDAQPGDEGAVIGDPRALDDVNVANLYALGGAVDRWAREHDVVEPDRVAERGGAQVRAAAGDGRVARDPSQADHLEVEGKRVEVPGQDERPAVVAHHVLDERHLAGTQA